MRTLKKIIWPFVKKRAWYIILLISSSLYVWQNRSEIYQLKELNAQNLIFILWLLLLFWPLFSEMEFLGVKVKKEVEKATGEVKESLAELRIQLMNLKISNSNATTFLIGDSLLSKEQLSKMLEDIKGSSEKSQKGPRAGANTLDEFEFNVPEQAIYLFKVGLSLERTLSKICEKTGYEGNQFYKSKVMYLYRIGFLSNETAKIISQIWTIANRGIHGETISSEYIDFVKKAVPTVFKELQDGDQSLNYCVCPLCNYKGYSVFENVCPRCGNVHDGD